MLTRFEDWPRRLDAAIQAAASRPFAWGQHDCCVWACDTVLDFTGCDLMAPLRGRYGDARSAALAMRRYAGAGLEAVARRLADGHWLEEVPPGFAQRGDVVLAQVNTPEGPNGGERRADALGLVGINGRDALFAGGIGLVAMPLRHCRLAWRIG